jgi:hypothetical protein
MGSTISGNLGGANAQNAVATLTGFNASGPIAPLYAVADNTGAYSFAGLAAGTYTVRAAIGGATGAFANYSFPGSKVVTVDGSSTYANINFTPTPPNATVTTF